IEDVVQCIKRWTAEVFSIFSSKRVLRVSNWPVCNVLGGRWASKSWIFITETLFEKTELSEAEREGIWWRNTKEYFS
ncbi:hypothetical protein K432DRAFT_313467, partial [Lepidopterella palustris CBS 459.81]